MSSDCSSCGVSYLGLSGNCSARGLVSVLGPDSVFSAGGGRSSVVAWYTTALVIGRSFLVQLTLTYISSKKKTTTTYYNKQQQTTADYNILQHLTTSYYNILQHPTTYNNILRHSTIFYDILRHSTTTDYHRLQQTTTKCNRLHMFLFVRVPSRP